MAAALTLLGTALLATGTLAGCGIGPQDHATTLATAGPTWTAPSTGTSPSAGLSIQVFLVHDGRLVQVWRQSPGGQELADVLATLCESPSARDRAEGLSSAIPNTVNRIHARIRRGVVLVQLPAAFDTLPSQDRVLAVAQLVYTVTAQLPVHGVRLMAGSRPVDTPVGSGRLVPRAVTRADFSKLAPSVD
ncbi:MAG TPA: GerMN domain-containing protein [Segeticoccus sp.]|nr:GerMN domain-containing protein [Segeticoccus sp.]